jgi:replication-associated recombination protein RarA
MLDSAIYDPKSPTKVEDIVGNTEIWNSTYKLIKANAASHIVLVGPAGSGKSLFLRIALSGFQTLIINCTANFGLRDVRDSIRIFARGSKSPDGNLRWIVFEHADSLTSDTQAFLRRMLETTSATTRIVFECKDAGAISEPILSRSTIVSVNAPDHTEGIFELLRRTHQKLPRKDAEQIVKHSYGNMRSAILNALSHVYCKDYTNTTEGYDIIQTLLQSRPADSNLEEWITWAISAEQTSRLHGIDLRDVLRIGWPTSPVVSNTCIQWSRLGGTSPRTLFFNSIAQLLKSA